MVQGHTFKVSAVNVRMLCSCSDLIMKEEKTCAVQGGQKNNTSTIGIFLITHSLPQPDYYTHLAQQIMGFLHACPIHIASMEIWCWLVSLAKFGAGTRRLRLSIIAQYGPRPR
jgi:hypothetical protein